jgi:hypothetical protein
MSQSICQERLKDLQYRLHAILDEVAYDDYNIYVDLGYINALIDHDVFIESEEFEELLSSVIGYEKELAC